MFRNPVLIACTLLSAAASTACHAGTEGRKVFERRVEEVWKDPQAVELVRATDRGDVAEIRQLVKSGVPVDALGEDQWTPLLWAVGGRNEQSVRALLELGAKANHQVWDPRSKAHWPIVCLAADKPEAAVLELLLKHGADPNTRQPKIEGSGYKGETLLMMAVMHKRNVELLVRHGADVNFVHELTGSTALGAAIGLGQLDVAELLLNSGATVRLDTAAFGLQNRFLSDEGRRIKLLRMLKERGAKIYPSKMYPDTPPDLLDPPPLKTEGAK